MQQQILIYNGQSANPPAISVKLPAVKMKHFHRRFEDKNITLAPIFYKTFMWKYPIIITLLLLFINATQAQTKHAMPAMICPAMLCPAKPCQPPAPCENSAWLGKTPNILESPSQWPNAINAG